MVPAVTVDQMRAVDRLMVQEMGITLFQMMENAGRALAELARRLLGVDARGHRILVLAGRGGNGGGGLAAARRLSIWGATVSVILGQPPETMRDASLHQLAILDRMGVPVRTPGSPKDAQTALAAADLVLDALIGYSLRGAPREPAASLIRLADGSGTRILALDVPSGLDADSGVASDPTIRAATTLTLALPKIGLLKPHAREWVGDLFVADISVPEEVYRQLGLVIGPLFARTDILSVPLSSSR
jgi:NAD(P)H-hydrate epimerase